MMLQTPYPWQADAFARVASQLQQQCLAHAYLIYGEPGIGKQDFAVALANFLLCQNPDKNKACGKCQCCRLAASGTQPDIFSIAPENDSRVIKIDQIRKLGQFAAKTSHWGARKVVILHPAEALNRNAANALLKTLEEPPGSTVLLLISDSPGRLPATIRSRCQLLLIARPGKSLALEWLVKRAAVEDPESLLAAAKGRPLLAREILENGSYAEQKSLLSLLAAIVQGQKHPMELVRPRINLNSLAIIEHLARTSSILIKYLLTHQEELISDAELKIIANHLMADGAKNSLETLLKIHDASETARQQINSSANPNVLLLLQNIARQWSLLA
jgi:DNA polymerase III subunit delta'